MPRLWTKAVKQCYSTYGQAGHGKANLACANLACPASTRPRLVVSERLKHVKTKACEYIASRVGAVKVKHVNRLIRVTVRRRCD
jgi:hypothetical protein